MTKRGLKAALRSILFPAAAALALAGCGGGMGGGGGGNPPPANRPPASPRRRPPASPRTAPAPSIPRPPPIRTAIRSPSRCPGGADRARFRDHRRRRTLLRGRRRISRRRPMPTRNNVYLVQISVSDGTTSATLNLTVTVTNVGPDAFRVAPGRHRLRPAALPRPPVPDGSGRVFVVEQAGRIRILNPATGAIAPTPFLDVIGADLDRRRARPARLRAGAGFRHDRHLLRLPDQPRRRHRDPPLPDPGRQSRPGRSRPPPTSSSPSPTRASSNHNGGWIDFGPDGIALHRASATAAAAATRTTMPRTRNVLLGKMLRIDRRAATPSRPIRCATMRFPPAIRSPPAAGRPKSGPMGLRNPFRTSFDPAHPESVDRRCRPGRARGDRPDAARPTAAPISAGGSSRAPRCSTARRPPAWSPPVAEYLHGSGPRAGQFGHRRLRLSRPGRGAARPIISSPISSSATSGRSRSRGSAIGTTIPSSQFILRERRFHPQCRARSTMSPASASTRPAISTSSTSTARSSGSRSSRA